MVYDLPSLNAARKRDKQKSPIVRDSFVVEPKYALVGQGLTYFIKTHGCQANLRDSEMIAGILEQLGYQPIEDEAKADLLIINTCAVRKNAEDKVFGELGYYKGLQKKHPSMTIALCGCMAQEESTIRTIETKYPQVELVFGTHNIADLPKLLWELYQNKKRVIEVYSKQGEVVEDLPTVRAIKHKAWVNIAYGCDKFCSYCIVPYTRGKERSRLMEDILKEVRDLKDRGYMEVCLLGQNVNAYGHDLDMAHGFAELLQAVSAIGIPRIRFMTSHPWNFDDETIDIIAENANIMPHIHLPLQSGNAWILKKMNRRYTPEDYLNLFDKLKARMPDCAITTDIIVGFPNESDAAFDDTLKMVDHCKFDNAFTFIFSPREGTPAYNMPDEIPLQVKQNRLKLLNDKIAAYALMNNTKYAERIVSVLLDGISKRNEEVYSGYTPENKLVNFTGSDLKVGSLVDVKITKPKSFSLDGIAVSSAHKEVL